LEGVTGLLRPVRFNLMNILLVEPPIKHIAPNIALMKWATWCERNGHRYQYLCGRGVPDFTPDEIYISLVFSYFSANYNALIQHYSSRYPKAVIRVGGAFPTLNESWFDRFPNVVVHSGLCPEIEGLPPKYSIDPSNRKLVMYASRGCTNRCAYCMVSKLEGAMHSLPSIAEHLQHGLEEMPNATSVVLYDNNFTAHEYLDTICDELEHLGLPVDIHGLHVRDFTEHHAKRFARLKWGSQSEKGTAYLRFGFDFLAYRDDVFRALQLVNKHKIPAGFFCYLLFNWKDTPDDFWRRLVLAQEMVDEVGRIIFLFPQRYEPLDALERNAYIGPGWTAEMVRGVVKIYTFLHGFLPLTKTRNLFNWIGYSKQEFFQNALNFATIKNYKLTQNIGPPPPTKELLAGL
jgi:hypothetical protein